jgi:hypothetical protein
MSHFVNITRFFFLLLAAVQLSSLEASGDWGKTGKTHEYNGAKWDQAYYKIKGLHFTASIPNYSGTHFRNDTVALEGKIDALAGYAIHMATKKNFVPPKKASKFIEMIKKANANHTVTLIDSKKSKASYGVDLTPKNDKTRAYWRFIVFKDHVIRMGTDDADAVRRTHFFDSIKIK